ncbi:MAG: radical SAM protein [Desulfatitalea sp.]|nr:radical SAM protein [Desulfatitalea sp.]NNK02467.1 radical SAM protein [Desulfatitalea sp.]
MAYQLKTAVWEITLACNMRCGHCGSRCSEKMPNELNTFEALRLCDELAELGLKQLTLSGGEPLLRQDWHIIAKRLSHQGVGVNLISNGWLIDDRLLELARDSGVVNIGISLDGGAQTHDGIRKKGAHARVVRVLALMKEKHFQSAVVTTILKKNIRELPQIQKVLEKLAVEIWQLQIGLPMGNLSRQEVIDPRQVEDIIGFACRLLTHGTLKPVIADSVGYYTKQTKMLWENSSGCGSGWMGCQAGKSNIGILHDGRITGCTSIRDDRFVEGNIREKSLRDIWESPEAFAWNRQLKKSDLSGFCAQCQFGEVCLAGCSSAKLSTTHDLTQNPYCARRNHIEDVFPKIENIQDVETLIARAAKAVSLDLYEIAVACLAKAVKLDPDHMAALSLLGFAHYKLENYSDAVDVNRKAITLDPNNAYLYNGLGICLSRQGNTQEGIAALRQAVQLADASFTDPFHDLAVILLDKGRPDEALEVLDQGCNRFSAFKEKAQDLYHQCRNPGVGRNDAYGG